MKSLMKNGNQIAEAVLTLEKAGLLVWSKSNHNQWSGKEEAVEAHLAFRLEKDGVGEVVLTSVHSDEFFYDIVTAPVTDKQSVLVKAYEKARQQVAATAKKVAKIVAKMSTAAGAGK